LFCKSKHQRASAPSWCLQDEREMVTYCNVNGFFVGRRCAL
jgi:hypothetical protein